MDGYWIVFLISALDWGYCAAKVEAETGNRAPSEVSFWLKQEHFEALSVSSNSKLSLFFTIEVSSEGFLSLLCSTVRTDNSQQKASASVFSVNFCLTDISDHFECTFNLSASSTIEQLFLLACRPIRSWCNVRLSRTPSILSRHKIIRKTMSEKIIHSKDHRPYLLSW